MSLTFCGHDIKHSICQSGRWFYLKDDVNNLPIWRQFRMVLYGVVFYLLGGDSILHCLFTFRRWFGGEFVHLCNLFTFQEVVWWLSLTF